MSSFSGVLSSGRSSKSGKNEGVGVKTIGELMGELRRVESGLKDVARLIGEDSEGELRLKGLSDIQNEEERSRIEESAVESIKERWGKVVKSHRDVHSAISRFGKATDKIFNERIDHLHSYFNKGSQIPNEIVQYSDAVNSLIFDYFLRIGRVEVASVFLEEDSVHLSDEERFILAEVTLIISSMRLHEFVPVKEWIKFNKDSMTEIQIIKFEYIVSKLEFLNTLSTDPANFEALIDCAKRMAIFARFFQPDFEYLMGSLAFIHNPERIKQFYSELFLKMHEVNSPCEKMDCEDSADLILNYTSTQNIINSLYYQHYLNELVSMFSEQVCYIKQCTSADPLFTLFCSGMKNITEFFNHDQIFKKLYLYNKIEDFPLTVKRHDHHFHHSIFHCPVDKNVASGDNSVLRLKCGHAISKSAFNQLTKNEQKTKMKCPYCPTETKTNEVLTLVL